MYKGKCQIDPEKIIPDLKIQCEIVRHKSGIKHGQEMGSATRWQIPEIYTNPDVLDGLDDIILQDNYAGKTEELLDRTLGPNTYVRGYLPFGWKSKRKQKIEELENED